MARPQHLHLAIVVFSIAAPTSAQTLPTFNDVVFGIEPTDAGGSVTLMIDIYLPPVGHPPYPCVLWIHGGGWQGGTYNNVPGFATQLLNDGVAIASARYRLSGEAIFPAQIHDVKGAVRFLRANAATYQLDTNRFGSWGSSAGGHLSALLAMSGGVSELEGSSGGNLAFSSTLQVCVDYFGPTDILNMNLDVTTPPGSGIDHDAPTSPESHLVGWDQPGQGIGDIRANLANPAAPYPALVALCHQVNPITLVNFGDPPTFIAHGTADTTVPIMQSTRLANALTTASVPFAYHQVPGAGHGGFPNATQIAAQEFLIAGFTSPKALGDLNCDGAVDLLDVEPFVLRLIDFTAHTASEPDCHTRNADFTADGLVNARDIPAFLDALL